MLAGLKAVDGSPRSAKTTPLRVIETLLPNILVKGGDYRPDTIVGADIVPCHGGEVRVLDFVEGYSSSSIIRKIREKRGKFCMIIVTEGRRVYRQHYRQKA